MTGDFKIHFKGNRVFQLEVCVCVCVCVRVCVCVLGGVYLKELSLQTKICSLSLKHLIFRKMSSCHFEGHEYSPRIKRAETFNSCSLGNDSIGSPVIAFASALVVLFSVMCPGELIILKETKAILFPASQDTNLFWLVILLWGLFAAAPGIKAPLKCSLLSLGPSCPCMCDSGVGLTDSPKTHSNVVPVAWLSMKTHMIWLNFKPSGRLVGWMLLPDRH